jgi:hypothetical protein
MKEQVLTIFIAIVVILGCATTPSKPVITENPWIQKKGHSGLPPTNPAISDLHERLGCLNGKYTAIRSAENADPKEDWIIFDGLGNFTYGRDFRNDSAEGRGGATTNEETGFYTTSQDKILMAFTDGIYDKCAPIRRSNGEGIIVGFEYHQVEYQMVVKANGPSSDHK